MTFITFAGVFPAHAGVIPAEFMLSTPRLRLPRACGGDPYFITHVDYATASSPRMRG